MAVHAGAESVTGEEVAEAFQALEPVLLLALGLGDIEGHMQPLMTAFLGFAATACRLAATLRKRMDTAFAGAENAAVRPAGAGMQGRV
ncbi:hypothetical protein GCM10010106_06020 [Thermopolyspora flexuosa]|nr:hypothetical protein GCM10010106_06020 [Thermopolyspora flexuosa]